MLKALAYNEAFISILLGCLEVLDLLGQPYRGWIVRKAIGKFWGNWSGRGLNLLPLGQRS